MIYLFLPAAPHKSPYLEYYTSILDRLKIEYKLFALDREWDAKSTKSNWIIYRSYSSCLTKKISSKLQLFKYSSFIKKILRKDNPDFVVVFTIQLGVLLEKFLVSKLYKKFILDIRDYSPILKYSFCKNKLNKIIEASLKTCISSRGFINFLPQEQPYLLSPNTRSIHPLKSFRNEQVFTQQPIKILTIGQIRDYDLQVKFIEVLRDDDVFFLKFIGIGKVIDQLKKYVEERDIKNVKFSGYYPKDKELEIASNYDFINACTPESATGKYLVSNRFYLSLLTGTPLLTYGRTFQSELVCQLGLGFNITNFSEIKKEIFQFVKNFKPEEFQYSQEKARILIDSELATFNRVIIDIFLNYR